MKDRILTIALALSLLATVFVAFPTNAAYEYTGSVATTDSTGAPEYVYIQGEQVYVNVEVRYQGELTPANIRVQLIPIGDTPAYTFNTVADDPVDGWYNSSVATSGLTLGTTGFWIEEERACYVVATETDTWTELARTVITVKKAGFFLEPDEVYISGYGNVGYYPGQTIDISMVTSIMTEMFYVQIVNETDVTVQNWTGQTAPYGDWHATWTIPTTLPNGDYTIRVRDSTTHLPWPAMYYQYEFTVRSFIFEAFPERDSYLVGEVASIDLLAIDLATLAPAAGVAVSYSLHWWNASGGDQWLNDTLSFSSGTHELQIPSTDIATWMWIGIEYTATLGDRSEEANVWLDLDKMSVAVDTNWNSYMPGDVVAVTVETSIDVYPLPDCLVDIKVMRNGTELSAYSVSGLVTDEDGTITYAFKLSPDAAIGTYSVEATASKAGASAVAACNFYVEEWGDFWIQFDKDYYLSGDTMVITFKAFWQGVEVTVGNLMVRVESDWGMLAFGNTSTMSFTAELPQDYVGNVMVYATGYYEDIVFNGQSWHYVYGVGISILPDKILYKPGDTLTFTWNVIGPVTNASLNYILYSSDLIIESASPVFAKTGTVTVEVPLVEPGYIYAVWISMLTNTGTYAEAEAQATIWDDGVLSVWAEKSKYADGSFKPGQTVKIGYEISNYWTDPLPLYLLAITCEFDPNVVLVYVEETEGVVEYTLPEDLATGLVGIDVVLIDPVGMDDLSEDSTTVMVNNRLSAWDVSIGGMAASDLLIVLLIIVMIVVLIVMPFVKGRQPKTEAAPAAEPEPAPPPEPPPKA